jgi:hypothetical protein
MRRLGEAAAGVLGAPHAELVSVRRTGCGARLDAIGSLAFPGRAGWSLGASERQGPSTGRSSGDQSRCPITGVVANRGGARLTQDRLRLFIKATPLPMHSSCKGLRMRGFAQVRRSSGLAPRVARSRCAACIGKSSRKVNRNAIGGPLGSAFPDAGAVVVRNPPTAPPRPGTARVSMIL